MAITSPTGLFIRFARLPTVKYSVTLSVSSFCDSSSICFSTSISRFFLLFFLIEARKDGANKLFPLIVSLISFPAFFVPKGLNLDFVLEAKLVSGFAAVSVPKLWVLIIFFFFFALLISEIESLFFCVEVVIAGFKSNLPFIIKLILLPLEAVSFADTYPPVVLIIFISGSTTFESASLIISEDLFEIVSTIFSVALTSFAAGFCSTICLLARAFSRGVVLDTVDFAIC